MSNFKKVESNQKFPEMEKEIVKFWEENKIFEKSLENRKDSKEYTFYDGPPFATGTPHYGHIVASVMKDVVPRYWTMRGRYVERKWGWDCHGLPIENIVEKELGSKKKKDIEEMGVEAFNKKCESKVLHYVDVWKEVVKRMGRWADMDNAYKTMDLDYMESVWWTFKELWDKDLIYEDYRSMHVCTRCETTLSQQEVAEGYKDTKDLSATAKFELQYQEGKTGRGVGVLIENDKEEILLVKRNEPGRKITWALPGGKTEKGESFEDALSRETMEELGVEIDKAEAISAKPDILEGRLFETVVFKASVKGEPKNMIPDELEKIQWFPKDKLPEINFPPSRYALELYLNNEKKLFFPVDTNRDLSNVYILAWTTTPWTLIGNVALAVGKDIEYTKVKIEEDYYVIAKDRLAEVLKDKEYELVGDLSGDELIGLNYKPLFDYYAGDKKLENKENGWKIYGADFVTTEEGTGVVHIAPAFGEDDMTLGREKELPFVQHVKIDGTIEEGTEGFVGLSVKPMTEEKDSHQKTDIEIIKYLAHNNLLFAKEKYEHSYPHCWRCDTPLINYATSSWFVAVTKIKDKALELAKEINWSPSHMKEGRFGKWLEGARDWSISRQRFWASVMPIWVCDKCEEKKVFGSVKDLEEISGEKITDIHKHVVDKITFSCEKCDGEMKRVPDVLDTWFDSGSMPYAQKHYPFENEKRFEETFPADFIAEGVDQTRAWFYYQHVIATGVKEKPAFKNVIVNGIVLAEDGKKMSKKLQNYPDPMEMFDKYGADSVRHYLMSSPVVAAQNISFMEKEVGEVTRGMIRMLWNSYSFFVLYANIDKFSPDEKFDPSKSKNLLDKWIISELHTLIKEFNEEMKNYKLHKASRLFPKFIDNLSNWYIRRSRKRFWKSENDGDKNDAYATLHYVLVEISKVMAPFTPFVTEEIYKNLTGEESVHLADFPEANEKLIDEKVNEEMEKARSFVNTGLQLRSQSAIKVRQPLQRLTINSEVNSELIEVIKEEVNVKEVEVDKKIELAELSTEITEDLKLEGLAREIIRHIQQMRKEADYEVDNRIKVYYSGLSDVFDKFGNLIAKETLADEVLSKIPDENDLEKEFEIDEEKIKIAIKK